MRSYPNCQFDFYCPLCHCRNFIYSISFYCLEFLRYLHTTSFIDTNSTIHKIGLQMLNGWFGQKMLMQTAWEKQCFLPDQIWPRTGASNITHSKINFCSIFADLKSYVSTNCITLYCTKNLSGKAMLRAKQKHLCSRAKYAGRFYKRGVHFSTLSSVYERALGRPTSLVINSGHVLRQQICEFVLFKT